MGQPGNAARHPGRFRRGALLAAAAAAATTMLLAALALAATEAHPLLRIAAAAAGATGLGLGALAWRMLAAAASRADAAASRTGALAARDAGFVPAPAEAARAAAATVAAAGTAEAVTLPAALLDDLPALLVGRFDANERCLQASASALRAQRGGSPATLRSLLGDIAYAGCAPHLREVQEGRLARFEALWPWRGRRAAVQVHLMPASKRAPDGSPPGFYLLVFDIGALRTAQARAAELAQRLDAFVEQAPGLVAQFDREGRWQLANRAHREWLDLEPAELVGRRLEALAALVPYGAERDAFARAQAGEVAEFECEWPGADGVRHWRSRLAPVWLADGGIGGVCAFATDVSGWRRAERALARAARRDPLTGLPNRAQLAETLPVALARARRQRRWLALLLVDLDGFARLNERHGHAVGDALLAECANRLALDVRGTDLVARLAGDQFVVVLEGLHGADEPQFVARKLGGCIERPFDTGERSAPISLSATIAIVVQAPDAAPTTPAALVACAALALDEAKAAGERFRTVPARPAAWPDAPRPA